MGGCGGKTSQNEVIQPQNNRQQRINNQYAQYMRLEHPLNVNHKYTAQFTIIPEQFVGDGIKKTNKYESRLSKQEWIAKRQDFWETRTEGKQENWQAIRTACETEEETAIAILSAGELKLVNKSLQIVYDSQNLKYDVPVFCINEPVSFPQKHSSESGIATTFQQQDLKVKVRSGKFVHDVEIVISNKTSISELKTVILEKQKEQKLETIRIFYSGREMQDHHQLGNYNLPQQLVLQAFCTTRNS